MPFFEGFGTFHFIWCLHMYKLLLLNFNLCAGRLCLDVSSGPSQQMHMSTVCFINVYGKDEVTVPALEKKNLLILLLPPSRIQYKNFSTVLNFYTRMSGPWKCLFKSQESDPLISQWTPWVRPNPCTACSQLLPLFIITVHSLLPLSTDLITVSTSISDTPDLKHSPFPSNPYNASGLTFWNSSFNYTEEETNLVVEHGTLETVRLDSVPALPCINPQSSRLENDDDNSTCLPDSGKH